MKVCPKCSKINVNGAVFCEECGTQLPSRKIITSSSLDKKWITILIEVAFAAVLILLIWKECEKINSAETVAQEYMQAIVEQDWEKTYSMLERKKGGFLSYEGYCKAHKENLEGKISTFSVKEKGFSKANDMVKEFNVQYMIKGETESHSKTIRLMKQKEKKLYFFSTWKVVDNDDIVEDYLISVPNGSSVALDGVLLDKDKMDTNSDQSVSSNDSYKVDMYIGEHDIQVAPPWCEVVKDTIHVDNTGMNYYYEYGISSTSFLEEVDDVLMAEVQDAMNDIYTAAIKEEDYKSVKDLFGKAYQSSNMDDYDDLVYRMHEYDDNTYGKHILKQIEFSNFNFKEKKLGSTDAGQELQVTISYKYSTIHDYIYEDWNYDMERDVEVTEEEKESGKNTVSAGFLRDGERYQLAWITMESY